MTGLRLPPELEAIRLELVAAAAGIRQLAESVPAEGWAARPAEGRWSAGEAIEHLSLTSDQLLPRLDAALAEGERMGARRTGPGRLDWRGRLLCWLLEPPYRMRGKTAAPFVPGRVSPAAETLARFEALQAGVLDRLERSADLATDRLLVPSPFAKVSYNLYSTFRVMATHQRRHLWQARQALEAARKR